MKIYTFGASFALLAVLISSGFAVEEKKFDEFYYQDFYKVPDFKTEVVVPFREVSELVYFRNEELVLAEFYDRPLQRYDDSWRSLDLSEIIISTESIPSKNNNAGYIWKRFDDSWRSPN